jgi:hypothetical protein
VRTGQPPPPPRDVLIELSREQSLAPCPSTAGGGKNGDKKKKKKKQRTDKIKKSMPRKTKKDIKNGRPEGMQLRRGGVKVIRRRMRGNEARDEKDEIIEVKG